MTLLKQPTGYAPCDVLITRDQRVYVNGTEVGMVTMLETSQELNGATVMRIEVHPTSLIYGQPPQQTIEDMTEPGTSDPNARVDIDRAIRKAVERKEKKGTP